MIAFLFPGQGSQAVGMGKDLAKHHPAARHTFEEADETLGYKLSELCFEGPDEKLKLTEITQPAILTASVAAMRVLAERGLRPAFVAGHSLGEYSAHVAAGTLTFSDALRIVRNRGRYMQDAVPAGKGAMAAVLGMAGDKVQQVCDDAAQGEICQPANLNSPEQTVISGNFAAVERAAKLANQRGAKKTVMLPVSAPFHCSLMKPARERLAPELHALHFAASDIPVVANFSAEPAVGASAGREALIAQITGAVRWDPSIRWLISRGVETFVEVGPGRVLSGLMRQIDRSKTSLAVSDDASLKKMTEQMAA